MSAPLTQIIVSAGSRQHTLKRARLGELLTTTDLTAFRAPFGTAWHKVGTGRADPELLPITGAVEGATLADSATQLQALLADLPAATRLSIGRWDIDVLGSTGLVSVTPTLAGWQVQCVLVRGEAA